MNEVQANGGIDDINARYITRMEGSAILMSYVRELYTIGSVKKDEDWGAQEKKILGVTNELR